MYPFILSIANGDSFCQLMETRQASMRWYIRTISWPVKNNVIYRLLAWLMLNIQSCCMVSLTLHSHDRYIHDDPQEEASRTGERKNSMEGSVLKIEECLESKKDSSILFRFCTLPVAGSYSHRMRAAIDRSTAALIWYNERKAKAKMKPSCDPAPKFTPEIKQMIRFKPIRIRFKLSCFESSVWGT